MYIYMYIYTYIYIYIYICIYIYTYIKNVPVPCVAPPPWLGAGCLFAGVLAHLVSVE